ncbi:type III effector [Pseudomonas sp. CDFA 602]|uniref:XopAH/AvrB family type III secretion system effector n=1 Tax=Pseudomonas californiensis TaxID=2829823 RepID=UPI001E29D4A7|nr:XopAH/AvrB family type III secretion system effector [Pseudomonas californiensis]MCD5997539.1 type III effector [Pseudomonas californiensis]MCD6003148.1 type III effector [Pseudomonas californiensis]
MGCITSKPLVSSPRWHNSATNSENLETGQRSHKASRYGAISGSPERSELTWHQQSLVGVARWPDKEYNRDHVPLQMEYGRSFWNESRKIGSALANGEIQNFEDLWEKARDWRCSMANHDENIFKKPRNSYNEFPFTTPLINQYNYIKDRYSARTDGSLQKLDDEGLLPPAKEFLITDKIFGEPISLTKIVCSSDSSAHRDQRRYSDLWSRGLDYGEPHYIQHTSSEEVPKILHHVNDLFNEVLQSNLSTKKALKFLGEIHWWLAHAMPDERGSAAKSELCVRAIAQAKGLDLPPMKSGIVPDLEAMTMSREQFIKQYPSMFDD